MAASTETIMSDNMLTDTANFEAFKTHFERPSQDSRRVILTHLRKSYPRQHITSVEKKDFDIQGFSEAGHASLQFLPGNVQTPLWDAVRSFQPPARRMESEDGRLKDMIKYGQYTLKYKDDTFTCFNTSWWDADRYRSVNYWYILSPKTTADAKGHHPATDKMLLDVARWTADLHEEIYVFDDSEWKKNPLLWQSVKDSTWEDVIMDPKMKQNLIEDAQGFFESQDLYKKFRVPWKRGIILHGVPGNGKTCSIKALMNYLGKLDDPIPSLYVKSLDNKCNMPQWSVRSIFGKAREMAPCLLVFEDLDSLISEKVRSYFLNEVDGLESNDGILMIGSTNHLNKLDPAIAKRPSRFDRKYHFRIPDGLQRELYAQYWRKKLQGTELDFPEELCPIMAKLTETFSFAYLKELYVVALLMVARGGKGDDESSDWEELSENNSAAADESGGVQKDAAAGQTAAADDAVDCAHCKHIHAEAATKSQKPKKGKKAVEVPVVEIPETLKGNVLLMVFQQQVKALLHEMDNSEEEENSQGIMASGDGDMIASLMARTNAMLNADG